MITKGIVIDAYIQYTVYTSKGVWTHDYTLHYYTLHDYTSQEKKQ